MRPVVAAAQRAGQVNPEQVEVVLRGLGKVDRARFDPAAVGAGEALLAGHASVFGPRDLQRFVEGLDPDGSQPVDELNADRRFFDLRPQRDGSWRGEFRLTGAVGAKLAAVLDPLTTPRTSTVPTGSGSMGAGRCVQELDRRSGGQRRHDAVEEVCDRILRAGGTPQTGGVPASVVVTIGYTDLVDRTGCGTTSDGTRLSVAAVLELAEQADEVPAVLNDTGAVLTLGRGRRIASRDQTMALAARDGGCSFPGCDRPPAWCERHHIVAWIDGEPTDLDNLTLVCRYHHHHFASRGWACRLNPDRLPEWIPPKHVDPGQTPMINHRILTSRPREGPFAAAA